MKNLTVDELIKEKSSDLHLELVAGKKGKERKITVSEINRPGLTLTGYFEYFRYERVQVIGRGEHSYLESLPPIRRREILEKFFSYDLPCVVITTGASPVKEFVEVAEKYQIPLFVTNLDTPHFVGELIAYLEEKLAPMTTLHGVLIDVYGLGVLILGESAIGKSECALELIKRGHMLITDDVVEIRQKPGGILMGTGKEMVSHHMEIRGIGIIDVRTLFGMGAILDSTRIELVIRLEEWDETKEYERLGLEQNYTTILDVKVPELSIPVRPGRNIAVLIEVAAMNQRLKNKGYYPARELDQKLIKMMEEKRKGNE